MLGPNTIIKQKQPCIRRRVRRPTLTNLMPVINHNNAQRHRIITEQRQVVKKQMAGTEILPGKLYLTSIYEAEDQNYLSEQQISAILTINSEPLKPGTPGTIVKKYLCLGDNCTANIANYFDEIINFIENNTCVLVHCYAGISRSATAVLAYLMKSRNMQLDGALSFLQAKRHIICPNFSFMGQLKLYERKLDQLKLVEVQLQQATRATRPRKLAIEWIEDEDRDPDSGVESGGSSSESGSPPLSPTEKKQRMTL